MPAISSGRRPYLSLNGPKNSCPAASPTMLVVRPNWTSDEEVWKKVTISGRVGRYISVTNGPKAVSVAKNKRMKVEEFFLLMEEWPIENLRQSR